MTSIEGCGFCQQCIRLKSLMAVKRENEHKIECAYSHILESFNMPSVPKKISSNGTFVLVPSPPRSCGWDCRWVSLSGSSSSKKSSYEDPFEYIPHLDPAIRLIRKRVQFSKRRSTKPK